MGWMGVVTNQGAAMLAELAGGGHTLTISGATVGSGYVADVNMRTATALQTQKMAGSIAGKESITGGIKLRLRVLAATVAVGAFTMHEIGVWGHLDSGTDKLILLIQDSVTGVPIPTESESREFVFDLIVPMTVSNTEGLEVTIDSDVFVTNADMVSYVAEAISGKADKTESLELTALANGWSNDEPPTQTISAAGVTGKEIGVGYGVLTSAQYEEAMNAMIWCTAQGTDEITLTCFGEVPTIDLPITVFIFG